MNNIESSLNQNPFNRQQKQYILKPNQKVYLYEDTSFSGTLIRPLERTYPPRWTVQLDRGSYESATVNEITPINPQYIETENSIPFEEFEQTDTPSNDKSAQQTENNRIAQLEKEIEILKTQYQIPNSEVQTFRRNVSSKNENEILNTGVEYAS